MPSEEVAGIEQELVLEAIHARYGYDFRAYSRESIRRRLQAALQKTGAKHLGDLQHRLLNEPQFFAQVLPCLTVKITEMFRDPDFFFTVRRDLIPILRTYPHLKIWHAGCATGEEAYSMAILALEEGLSERALIYATDLDSSAISQAKEGVYSSAQIDSYAKNYEMSGGRANLDDYITRGYSRVAFRDAVRRRISFFQHDLTTDFVLGEMNMILCRNVALYFSNPLRERVARLFADGLCAGGFLCLGSSETIPSAVRDQFEVFPGEHRIFRKKGRP